MFLVGKGCEKKRGQETIKSVPITNLPKRNGHENLFFCLIKRAPVEAGEGRLEKHRDLVILGKGVCSGDLHKCMEKFQKEPAWADGRTR